MLKPKAEQIAKSRYFINEKEDWEGLSRRVGTGAASVESTYELQQEYGEKTMKWLCAFLFLHCSCDNPLLIKVTRKNELARLTSIFEFGYVF